MAHVVEERLFQFGLLRQLAGFYQLLLVVFQFLDILQQSGYDGCVSGGVDGIVAEDVYKRQYIQPSTTVGYNVTRFILIVLQRKKPKEDF